MTSSIIKLLNQRAPRIGYKLPLLGLLVGLVSIYPARAQKWEFGGGFGSFLYSGDLNTYYDVRNVGPAGMLLGRLNLNSASVLRVTMSAGVLQGNAKYSSNRAIKELNGSSFSTPIYEAGVAYEYNFFDYRKYKSPYRGTPYIVGGLSTFFFNPQPVEDAGRGVAPVQIGIPMGLGYKYPIDKAWNIGAEASFRYVFTPYLDNSATFINNDPKTQRLNRFGDAPSRGFQYFNDWYMFAGVTLTYTIYNVECPLPDNW